MDHSFNIAFADKHGIEESIVFCYLHYWCVQNKINGLNQNKDASGVIRSWTYNSCKAFTQIFCYMSEAKIRRTLKSLEDKGLIVIDNFNKSAYDRTCWYAITEKGEEEFKLCVTEYNFDLYENASNKKQTSILQNRQMDVTNSKNQSDKSEEPIPIINTLDNTIINLNVEESKYICEESKKLNDIFISYCKRDNLHFSKKPDIIKKWTETIGKIHYIDGYSWNEIKSVIDYAKNDKFWKSNILSADKLRKQMEQLYVKSQNSKTPNNKKPEQYTDEDYLRDSDDLSKTSY